MTAPLIASFAMSGLPGDPCSVEATGDFHHLPILLIRQVVDFTQDG